MWSGFVSKPYAWCCRIHPFPLKSQPSYGVYSSHERGLELGNYVVFVWWLQDNFYRRQGLKALQSIKDIEKRTIQPYSRHERSRIVRGSRS